MLFSILLALAVTQKTLALANPTLANYTKAFIQAHIVPDVLASFMPTAFLDVIYTDPATNESLHVSPGVRLSVEQTQKRPQFFLASDHPALQNQSFVLAMVDPDAPTPSNRSLAQIRHLIAGDFSLNENPARPKELVNSSAAISEYVATAPPPGSDPHRYVILAYVQPPGFDDTASALANASGPITNFNLTTFVTSAGLGNPIAGTFFLAGPSTNTSNSTLAHSSTSASPSNGVAVERQFSWGTVGVLGLAIAAVYS